MDRYLSLFGFSGLKLDGESRGPEIAAFFWFLRVFSVDASTVPRDNSVFRRPLGVAPREPSPGGEAMNSYERIFGNGPLGLAISVGLLALAVLLEDLIGLPEIGLGETTRTVILYGAGVLNGAVAIWAFTSLPAEKRGRELCTVGAYRWVRHPLYAGFLTIFDFGLAVFLDNWLFVIWALALHPIWHVLMRREERLVAEVFPESYPAYCAITPRFVPNPFRRGAT